MSLSKMSNLKQGKTVKKFYSKNPKRCQAFSYLLASGGVLQKVAYQMDEYNMYEFKLSNPVLSSKQFALLFLIWISNQKSRNLVDRLAQILVDGGAGHMVEDQFEEDGQDSTSMPFVLMKRTIEILVPKPTYLTNTDGDDEDDGDEDEDDDRDEDQDGDEEKDKEDVDGAKVVVLDQFAGGPHNSNVSDLPRMHNVIEKGADPNKSQLTLKELAKMLTNSYLQQLAVAFDSSPTILQKWFFGLNLLSDRKACDFLAQARHTFQRTGESIFMQVLAKIVECQDFGNQSVREFAESTYRRIPKSSNDHDYLDLAQALLRILSWQELPLQG